MAKCGDPPCISTTVKRCWFCEHVNRSHELSRGRERPVLGTREYILPHSPGPGRAVRPLLPPTTGGPALGPSPEERKPEVPVVDLLGPLEDPQGPLPVPIEPAREAEPPRKKEKEPSLPPTTEGRKKEKGPSLPPNTEGRKEGEVATKSDVPSQAARKRTRTHGRRRRGEENPPPGGDHRKRPVTPRRSTAGGKPPPRTCPLSDRTHARIARWKGTSWGSALSWGSRTVIGAATPQCSVRTCPTCGPKWEEESRGSQSGEQ